MSQPSGAAFGAIGAIRLWRSCVRRIGATAFSAVESRRRRRSGSGSARGIPLSGGFDGGEDPQTEQDERAHDDPVDGDLHESGPIDQSAQDQDDSRDVDSERHGRAHLHVRVQLGVAMQKTKCQCRVGPQLHLSSTAQLFSFFSPCRTGSRGPRDEPIGILMELAPALRRGRHESTPAPNMTATAMAQGDQASEERALERGPRAEANDHGAEKERRAPELLDQGARAKTAAGPAVPASARL